MKKEHVHFIGIGGSGLSAIARVLLERGYTVSGSDRTPSPLTQELEDAGMKIFIGHKAEHISGAGFIIRSSAVPEANPEVQAARAANIPVLKRMDFLGSLIGELKCLAVAGTHGKTTTTSMLAYLLTTLGKDPSYIIGGVAKNLGSNAHAGQGEAFVIEADEYDFMFHGLNPDWAIVTNVEHDHPDCYPTQDDYKKAFIKFVQNIRPDGGLIVSEGQASSELVPMVLHGRKTFTYGFTPASNYTATGITPNQMGGFSYRLNFSEGSTHMEALSTIDLQVPGKHNVMNSLSALAVIHQIGLPVKEAAQALSEFIGAGRRFDILGEAGGVVIIDDYAHHPTEILITLEAARARYPSRRVWAVWQPHTFTRIQTLKADFATAFEAADQVVVTEIYAAREKNSTYSAKEVADIIATPNTHFIASLEGVTRYLLKNLRSGDVLLVLSAGDANMISQQVYKGLLEKDLNHKVN